MVGVFVGKKRNICKTFNCKDKLKKEINNLYIFVNVLERVSAVCVPGAVVLTMTASVVTGGAPERDLSELRSHAKETEQMNLSSVVYFSCLHVPDFCVLLF